MSPSQICDLALGIVLDGAIMDKKTIVLELNKMRQRMIVAEIAAHELDLKYLTDMLDMGVDEFGKAKAEYDEMAKSNTIANVMRSINDVIVECEFRVEDAWKGSEELRKQLEELNYPIDYLWFRKHVLRVSRWM